MDAPTGEHLITTPGGEVIASLTITQTPWPIVQRPAGASASPAPAGRLAQDRAAKNRAYSSHQTRWQDYHLQAPLRHPLEAAHRISGSFGLRRMYGKSGTVSIHSGVDLAPPTSGAWSQSPPSAHSMAPGVVVLAQSLWLEGNMVVVYHGDSIYTTYCHLKNMRVKVGALVAVGTPVGHVGSTGHSSGPHLHLALRIHGVNVDPLAARDTLNSAVR